MADLTLQQRNTCTTMSGVSSVKSAKISSECSNLMSFSGNSNSSMTVKTTKISINIITIEEYSFTEFIVGIINFCIGTSINSNAPPTEEILIPSLFRKILPNISSISFKYFETNSVMCG